LKTVLIGDKALWKSLTQDCTGYSNVTTPNGTPVMWVEGLGRQVWLVDIISRVELGWVSPKGKQALVDFGELLTLM
jgi:hypothetical protein